MAKLDDFGQLALAKYNDTLTDYNGKVKAAKSVSSVEEFTETFMETAPELAEINAQIEKISQAMEAALAKRLSVATPLITPAYEAAVKGSGVDLVALDEQLKLLRTTAKYLTAVYGDDVLEGTEKIEGRGKSGGNSGTGGRRIRGFEIYIDGKLSAVKTKEFTDKDGVVHPSVLKSTFSCAAKELEVDTVELQRAFFEAAGSENVKDESFPDVVEFQFKDHNIRAAKVDEDESE
jgi:hypothetical protein